MSFSSQSHPSLFSIFFLSLFLCGGEMRIFSFSFLFLLMLGWHQLQGETVLYISPNGATTGSCSTLGSACSLVYGASIVTDGETLDLSGTFDSGDYNNGNGVTINKNISITSSNLNALLTFPMTFTNNITIFDVSSNVIFSNLDFTTSTSSRTISFDEEDEEFDQSFASEPKTKHQQNSNVYSKAKSTTVKTTLSAIQISGATVNVAIEKCRFYDVRMDYTAVDGNMISVMSSVTNSAAFVLSQISFDSNENVTLFRVTRPAVSPLVGLFSFEMANCILANNVHYDHNEAIITMDYSKTQSNGFSSTYSMNQFLENDQPLINVQLPSPLIADTDDTNILPLTFMDNYVVGNNFSVPKAPSGKQYPFYLIDFSSPTSVGVMNLTLLSNFLDAVFDSSTDPTYFGGLHVGFLDSKYKMSQFMLGESIFNFNTQLTPVVVEGTKKIEFFAVVSDCEFVNNSAAVTAGLSFLSTAPDGNISVSNCEFLNNSVVDPDVLLEWGLSGDLIFCGGKSDILLDGNFSFEGNDDKNLRWLASTCSKTCEIEEEGLDSEVCGEAGITTSTIIMSCVLGIVVIGLVTYHLIYVFIQLPKKKKEEEYSKLQQQS